MLGLTRALTLRCCWLLVLLTLILVTRFLSHGADTPAAKLPTVEEMAASHTDLWGEAALRQPDGPSYEFFKDLLPPLRYVNTGFRHYPIVLSAPSAAVKARWVSNGSSINARANKPPMWREIGAPVLFRVGEKAEPFGEDIERCNGPRYAEGFLPIVQIDYTQGKPVYEQEAFGSVRGAWAEHGTVLVRFSVREAPGTLTVRLDQDAPLRVAEGALLNAKDQALLLFDPAWSWQAETRDLSIQLTPGRSAVLAVPTQPLASSQPRLTAALYEEERKACVNRWKELLARGSVLEVPEPLIQNAWRSLVVGNYLVAVGDRMHYSAGNAYDHLYEAECGDATRALLLYGFTKEAQGMVGPLLDFKRQATRYHVAGHKLQLLAHYYWVTRDVEYLREKEPIWKPVMEFIRSSRQKNGLLPRDNYAGDINQQVLSLNSNANCWRGMRDMAAVLADMGERDRARELFQEAQDYRKAILDAVARSERRDVKPPFIPNALLGEEQPYETLTASRMGSYYDLMAPYTIGSQVFGSGSERETWMIDYLRQHGGIALGMIRSMPHQGEFNQQPGVNVLYGLRYMLALLQRDDRDHALVGFYGHLAQGMTRETFIGGEGSRFIHGDRLGRSFYLPPNTASNAMFLTTLRYLIIQDWLKDSGEPETLRLLFGAPGRWLKDGAVLKMERAPTMFGEVSFRVESKLAQGEVLVQLDSPTRQPEKWQLRLPLPSGWRVTSAHIAEKALALGKGGVVDLAGQSGRFSVRFRVEK